MKIKLEAGAAVPVKAHPTDAAHDLAAFEDTVIPPHYVAMVRTGLSMAIPFGCYGDIRPRSSLFSRGIDVSGVIDSGYRGEIKVMIHNHSNTYYHIKQGDRIAQIIFLPAYNFSFEVVDTLPESDRGAGGFGSSGI